MVITMRSREKVSDDSHPTNESIRALLDGAAMREGLPARFAVKSFNERQSLGIVESIDNLGQIGSYRVYHCRWTDQDLDGNVLWSGNAQVAVPLADGAHERARLIVVADNLSRESLGFEFDVADARVA